MIYIVNIDTGRATSRLPEAPDMAERCLGVTGCRSATEDDVSLRHCWVVWVLFDWVLPGPKVPDLKSLCSWSSVKTVVQIIYKLKSADSHTGNLDFFRSDVLRARDLCG